MPFTTLAAYLRIKFHISFCWIIIPWQFCSKGSAAAVCVRRFHRLVLITSHYKRVHSFLYHHMASSPDYASRWLVINYNKWNFSVHVFIIKSGNYNRVVVRCSNSNVLVVAQLIFRQLIKVVSLELEFQLNSNYLSWNFLSQRQFSLKDCLRTLSCSWRNFIVVVIVRDCLCCCRASQLSLHCY